MEVTRLIKLPDAVNESSRKALHLPTTRLTNNLLTLTRCLKPPTHDFEYEGKQYTISETKVTLIRYSNKTETKMTTVYCAAPATFFLL